MPHRRLIVLTAAFVLALQGCATPPAAPPVTGPAAIVADTATGGGAGGGGGAFFFVAEVDGQPVTVTSLTASRAASRGRGPVLQLRTAERPVPAGVTTRLKLSGRYEYASPIQNMVMTASSYAVDGVVEVALRPGVRYEVKGQLDTFRRDVWLQEADSGRIVGAKVTGVVEPPKEAAKAMENAAYTCCNLHYDGTWISGGNWAALPFLPAGSRIVVKDFGRQRVNVLIDGRPMSLGLDFGREWETREQLAARLVVKDDPALRLATYDAGVQAAIRAGKVRSGMTPEQVVMALGHPLAGTTASLDAPVWHYWLQEDTDPYDIVWGPDRRVLRVDAAGAVRRIVVHGDE